MAALVFATLAPALARANPADLFGLGAHQLGTGGGHAAWSVDASATHRNPAGLVRLDEPTLALGGQLALFDFDDVSGVWWDTNQDGRLDDADAPLVVPVDPPPAPAVNLLASTPLGDRVVLGLAATFPTNRLIRFSMMEPTLPVYLQYDNRPSRFVLTAGLGVRLHDGLTLGASVDVLAQGRFDVEATVRSTLTPPETDDAPPVSELEVDLHEINLDLAPAVAPIVGVELDLGAYVPAVEGFVIAASWRGAVGLPIAVSLGAQADLVTEDVGDLEPIVAAAVVDGTMALIDHHQPMRVVLGTAWRPEAGPVQLAVDVEWNQRSVLRLNVAQLDQLDAAVPGFGTQPLLRDGNSLATTFRDTWTPRVGAAFRTQPTATSRPSRWEVRVGGAYHPAWLVSQGASTALLDTPRIQGGAGLSWSVYDPFGWHDHPLVLDLAGQISGLLPAGLPHGTDQPRRGYLVEGDVMPIGGVIGLGTLQVGTSW